MISNLIPVQLVREILNIHVKNVKELERINQNAILCAGCNVWSHASCLGLTNLTFKHSLDNLEKDWVCGLCSLPFNTTLGADYLHQNSFEALNLSNLHEINIEANSPEYPNDVSNPPETESTIVDVRQINPSEAFIMHLNINSLQNKFEELKTLNQALQAHILVISETKINSSYPNSQFALSGYHMYRKDRVKGGGGIITYVSSSVPSRKLTLAKSYKTLEAIAIEVRIGRRYIVCLAVYRPPKQSGKKTLQRNSYAQSVEQEINDLVMWASLQKQTIVLVGDLNMDRLKPNEREGKILTDLEEVNNMTCMISEPTRITPNSSTLLDVILTNTSELFRKCGVYDPAISDHSLVFGIMKENVCKCKSKVITFRSLKNTDIEQLNRDLLNAPWHVADIFNDIDDKYNYWSGLFESVVDAHAPLKRKKVRDKDTPYMTMEWKKAIRNKRKYAIKFAKDHTEENFELKKKYRNIANKERRKAVRAYWHMTSEELRDKPSEFYKTFKPFLSDKVKGSPTICLRTDEGTVKTNQFEVAELLADYFNTAALSIGGDHVNDLTERDHDNHNSVKIIRETYDTYPVSCFEFRKLSQEEVLFTLEHLNSKTSSGWNPGITPDLLKRVARGVFFSSSH